MVIQMAALAHASNMLFDLSMRIPESQIMRYKLGLILEQHHRHQFSPARLGGWERSQGPASWLPIGGLNEVASEPAEFPAAPALALCMPCFQPRFWNGGALDAVFCYDGEGIMLRN